MAAGNPSPAPREDIFASVIASDAAAGFNNSLLLQLLAQKKKHPGSRSDSLSAPGDPTCAAGGREPAAFLDRHPDRGMPFGLPPISREEYQIIAGWLAAGAQGPVFEEEAALAAIPGQDLEKLSSWEEFLNRADAKHAMTARYLYEHLFLAHITFSPGSRVYYELIRSRTPSGVPIEAIPTIRPYDDPGAGFFYRFRRLQETTLARNHIVMELGSEQLKRAHDLFIRPDWLMQPHRVGYGSDFSANPFAVFEQIPPRSRYQFLLDNALPVVMTVFQGRSAGCDTVLLIHRWHDDVTTLRREERHHDAAKDRADFFAGFIGASPDYFFAVDQKDIADFLDVLRSFEASPKSSKRLAKYGVDRSETRFWEVNDWFQDRYSESGPERSGVFALNRYARRLR